MLLFDPLQTGVHGPPPAPDTYRLATHGILKSVILTT